MNKNKKTKEEICFPPNGNPNLWKHNIKAVCIPAVPVLHPGQLCSEGHSPPRPQLIQVYSVSTVYSHPPKHPSTNHVYPTPHNPHLLTLSAPAHPHPHVTSAVVSILWTLYHLCINYHIRGTRRLAYTQHLSSWHSHLTTWRATKQGCPE